MNILGIDLETTSLDVQSCYIVEIGMVLWDTGNHQPLFQAGGLVEIPNFESLPEVTTKITGISSDMMQEAIPWTSWERQLKFLAERASYFVAHNHEFDRPILERHFDPSDRSLFERSWIDTMTDLPYPPEIKTRKLDYLCFEHGFFNPFPHRALTDVLSMLKILSFYPLEKVLQLADSPNVWLRADVSIDNRHKAKQRNFIWDPLNKYWVKQTKLILSQKEIQEADFGIEILQGYSYKQQYV